MTNEQRLLMETKGITLESDEISIYLEENGLKASDQYNPDSKNNLIKIYQSALSILESIANNPQTMKNYKEDDLSVSHFHINLQKRIDRLENKIRNLKIEESKKGESNYFMLFIN